MGRGGRGREEMGRSDREGQGLVGKSSSDRECRGEGNKGVFEVKRSERIQERSDQGVMRGWSEGDQGLERV